MCSKTSRLFSALVLGLCIFLAGQVTAQTFTTLYSFTATQTNSLGVYTNSDGTDPNAGLVLAGNALYGTTLGGGTSGAGTVFRINSDGTAFSTLYSFTSGSTNSLGVYTNSDGAGPWAGLTLSGNALYGTTRGGGNSGNGTVFRINSDGNGLFTLHNFSETSTNSPYGNIDGSQPAASLILIGNTLYGTAQYGGSSGGGTVFSVNTDGSAFTIVHDFTCILVMCGCGFIDGSGPGSGLTLSDDTLYGTTFAGGSAGCYYPEPWGTAFSVKTNGTDFKSLHQFLLNISHFDGLVFDADGLLPYGGLTLAGNRLYGTANTGGSQNSGTIYTLNGDGTDFEVMHTFSPTSPSSPYNGTNSDGANPYYGNLTLVGNTLYGAAHNGGESGRGTIFALNTDGTNFRTLHSFTAADGFGPNVGLIQFGNSLYGTTIGGGSSGQGTVFSILLPPQLTVIRSATDLVLSWATNYPGLTLQSTTNLGSAAVWATNSSAPVVVNAENVVTNPISSAQQFYRLAQ